MIDLEHERRLTDVEARSKSNARRIEDIEKRQDDVEKRQDDIEKLATSVEILALRESNVENDVKEIKADVKGLTNKSGQKWESLIDKIVTVLVAAIVGFILAKIGL